jgi:branched-chain amino acid transport system permease protein
VKLEPDVRRPAEERQPPGSMPEAEPPSLRSRLLHPRFYVAAVAVSLFLVIPLSSGSAFVAHVFVVICTSAALALAWNIVGGFGGQLSLGHSMFYGIGAYTSTLLLQHLGWSPWIGMVFGAAIAAVVGAALSYPCLRLRGPFFALSTIAFLEVLRLLAIHEKEWTGGSAGLIVPLHIGWTWMIFREKGPYLVIAFGLMLMVLLASMAVRHSRFGYYLVAVREREDAAMAAGVNTVRVKILGVMVSAALTATVGTFMAMYTTFLEPASMFSLGLSVQIAMFALIGGLGTVAGPIAGTVLVVPLSELARGWLGASANGLHGFVYGTVLVLTVLTIPSGLVGALGARVGRLIDRLPGGRRTPSDSATPVRAATALLRSAAAPSGNAVAGPGGERPAVLVANRLRKNFGGLVATRDVSLSLREGEIIGIIGPNGAGKTTLFNLLSGFLRASAGSVSIASGGGHRRSMPPHRFAKLGLGRTFQIVQPFGKLTVLENIMIGAFLRHRRLGEARRCALRVAALVGLGDRCEVEARNLTIGNLKRLEVARTLATEPSILLLDEVMAGQNAADVHNMVELVRRIRDSGVSVIAIEHNMQAIMSLSDRIIVVNAGSVIAEGSPAEIGSNRSVIEAYLGEEYTHAQA